MPSYLELCFIAIQVVLLKQAWNWSKDEKKKNLKIKGSLGSSTSRACGEATARTRGSSGAKPPSQSFRHQIKTLNYNTLPGPATIMSRADNSVKIWQNLPISNPKPDFHNNNAHTKFWWKYIDHEVYSSYRPETKNGGTDGRLTDRCSKNLGLGVTSHCKFP